MTLLKVEASDLDLAIASTGIFLQKINGEVNNVAPSNDDNVEFTGIVGLTYGPEININLDNNFFVSGDFSGAAISLEVDATVSEDNLSGGTTLTVIDESIFKFTGDADFRWEGGEESFTANGNYTALAGILEGDSNLEFDFIENEVTAFGNVTISFPDTDFFADLGGQQVFDAASYFKYTDDSDNSNDYFAAWGVLQAELPEVVDPLEVFEPIETFAGIQLFFNGEYQLLDAPPADIPDDLLAFESIPFFNDSFQFAIDEQFSITSNSFTTSQPDELLQPQTIASTPKLSQFEEIIEVDAGEEYAIFLSVQWDNSVNSEEVPLLLLTPEHGVIEEADFPQYYPDIYVVSNLSDDNQKTVVVRNPAAGNWGLTVSDSNKIELENVRTYFRRVSNNADPTLEILDVSQNTDGSEVTITYEAEDPDTETTFDLYYTTEPDGDYLPSAQSIVSDLPENDGTGTYVWNTQGVATGEYYIYGVIKDQFGLPRFNSNYSAQTVQITGEADVSVSISADVDEVVVGEELTYTAIITNSGEIDAQDLNLYITLPDESSLIDTSLPASAPEDRIEEGLGDIVFRIDQLSSQTSQTIDITVDAPNSAQIPGSATAWLTVETYDPNGDNNRDDVYVLAIVRLV